MLPRVLPGVLHLLLPRVLPGVLLRVHCAMCATRTHWCAPERPWLVCDAMCMCIATPMCIANVRVMPMSMTMRVATSMCS